MLWVKVDHRGERDHFKDKFLIEAESQKILIFPGVFVKKIVGCRGETKP